ncbi:hypothetical protein Hte_010614 [Hypoxylon texense]
MAESYDASQHGRNFIESVKGIPVLLPPPGSPYKGTPGVSLEDMGANDPNTISYFNIKTNNIPPGHQGRIKKIEEMIDLTHLWLDVQAGKQTAMQKHNGNLPNDDKPESKVMCSNYRIKVIDYIMMNGNCPWIAVARSESASYKIKVKKAEFHTSLIRNILSGITTVKSISNSIEKVFEGLSEIIRQSQDVSQSLSVWSFFNVFTWDDVTNDVKGSIRIVSYTVSGEMVQYTVHKASYQEAKMDFSFLQGDFIFVEGMWAYNKPIVVDFLKEEGEKKVREVIGADITP